MVVRVTPLPLSDSQQILAPDPGQLTIVQMQPVQGTRNHNIRALTAVEIAPSQPPSTLPLSPSPGPGRQLTIVPHPNPLRDVRVGTAPGMF